MQCPTFSNSIYACFSFIVIHLHYIVPKILIESNEILYIKKIFIMEWHWIFPIKLSYSTDLVYFHTFHFCLFKKFIFTIKESIWDITWLVIVSFILYHRLLSHGINLNKKKLKGHWCGVNLYIWHDNVFMCLYGNGMSSL